MFKIYKDKAAKIGVEIKKSTNPKKKFDAYKNGEKQNSFGAASYMDYEKYKKDKGLQFANEKRNNYRARHQANINL
jgi:hypothetical protein